MSAEFSFPLGGTSDELFEALMNLLDRAPGVAVVGYVCPRVADSYATVDFVRNQASPSEFDAAVLAAKRELVDLGRDTWIVSGTHNTYLSEYVSRLSALGAFVFVCLVPWPDRAEDVTVYWAAPSGDGELVDTDGAAVQAVLLLDAELSATWQDETGSDRVSLFEPARLDPEALPL